LYKKKNKFKLEKKCIYLYIYINIKGGGAIEMEISKYLRDYARSIAGKEQMIISALARSFEIIPRQLCENAGFDATDILNK
jgi:T-complex protein 1 subunit eta